MSNARLHQNHPYLVIVTFLCAMLLPLIAAGAAGKLLQWPDLITYAAGLGLTALVAAWIVTRMKWWRHIGFRRWGHYHLIWIFVAAIIGDVVNNWTGGIALTAGGVIALALLVTVLGAFCEEVFYRGLMLRVLEPKGRWLAVIVTALLFGSSHLLNAAAGMSQEVVLWQLLYASGYGLAYAAFALRTGTIWPIIITHFLNNFLILLVSGWETQTQEVTSADRWFNIVYTLGFTAYAIVLLRDRGRSHDQGQSAAH